MNNKIIMPLILCLVILNLGCTKEKIASYDVTQSRDMPASGMARGAVQVEGISYYNPTDACNLAAPGLGATYAIDMTGDLDGCWYIFVDEYQCSPSGTYREIGREYFVGTYNGQTGSFWTTYKFEARYEGCSPDGSYIGAEIFGRCQHPIVAGTGTGVFAGATGRLDMKDDIEAGNYPYRGHIKFP